MCGRLATAKKKKLSQSARRAHERTVAAYRAWAERAGSQAAGVHRRARLVAAAPLRARVRAARAARASARAARFDLLATLGAAGRYELEPDALHSASRRTRPRRRAKRALLSGDKMLLERRARDLAAACDVPLAALDRGLALWDDPAWTSRRPASPARGARRARAGVRRARAARGGASLATANDGCHRHAEEEGPRARAGRCRARPWRLLLLGCLALAALAHFLPAAPDLRPVGLDHLGPRDHRVGPRHARRARRGSRCRCCSRRRSRWPATRPRPSCG